jgi:acyl-CoA reductase-like NAD-dependent aldehyde dehydrogenase
VGEVIKRTVGLRKVALELGNNSATIVHHDADLSTAAEACARQAFSNSGQVCISVQRVYVHNSVADEFITSMTKVAEALKVGNPEDASVEVGPMIDSGAADRAMRIIADAVEGGAEIACGGTRTGNTVHPTVLLDTASDRLAMCDEVFAPIVSVVRYDDLQTVIGEINQGRFGLQCGVFTGSLETAFAAGHSLRMGGVIINGTSRYRADVMPYGGIKASGEGREGPKYVVEEMTERKLVVLNLTASPNRNMKAAPAAQTPGNERNS